MAGCGLVVYSTLRWVLVSNLHFLIGHLYTPVYQYLCSVIPVQDPGTRTISCGGIGTAPESSGHVRERGVI